MMGTVNSLTMYYARIKASPRACLIKFYKEKRTNVVLNGKLSASVITYTCN